MVRPALTIALLSALLAGCVTVGPDYHPPAAQAVTLQGLATPAFDTDATVALWWGQFDDPVLEQLIATALAENLDLYIAQTRVRAARAAFAGQRAQQLPQAVLQGSQHREHAAPALAGDSETFQLGFDAAWELDLFGGRRRAVAAARGTLGAEVESLVDAQVTLAAEVARNYFQLRGTQKRLALARQTLTNLEQTQRITQARWQLGAGSELEVQGSRTLLKALQAELPVREIEQLQAMHRLAVLAGQRPGALNSLLQPRPVAAFARALPLGDTRGLLQQRADVRAAERRLAAATARIGVATAALFPRVSISGFVGFLSADAGGMLGADNRAWSLTPALSWAAFDMGSLRAQLRATQAQADAVAAEYEKTVLLALEETENALARYAHQQQRLLAVVEQSQAATRAAVIARARYEEGSEGFLSLLDAQRMQLQADDALATTEAQLNMDVVTVYKALGGWGSQRPMAAAAAR